MTGPSREPEDIVLCAGSYRARVSASGAGLTALTFHEEPIVLPVGPGEVATAYQGKVLTPWPNRITDGAYSFRGADHQLSVSEPETGAAIHGLLCWTVFSVRSFAPASVVLTADLAPQPGYPFPLCVTVRYSLDSGGLHGSILTTNRGAVPAPYGVGVHPYLRCGPAAPDDCHLHVPADGVVTGGDGTNSRRVPQPLDFRAPRLLGDAEIDHAFTTAPSPWVIALRDPGSGLSVRMSASSPYVQVYTGERLGRRGIAIEPMTCPPDAFNTGVGRIELEGGASHRFDWSIDAVIEPEDCGRQIQRDHRSMMPGRR